MKEFISVDKLAYYARRNEKKNLQFRIWLKTHVDEEDLDERCRRLHDEYFAQYDCSKCRNCCKSCHGSIPEEDFQKDADHLGISREEFIEKYIDIEKGGDEGNYDTKHMPCDFLNEDGACMLGENKPEACVKYPYTAEPGRLWALYSMIDNTAVCPVAYEIFEELKREYGFNRRRK